VSLAIFDAEEGTAGTTLSTANTAFDSVTIGSGASGTFSSTSPLFGSLSYQFVHPSSSAASNVRVDSFSGTTGKICVAIEFSVSALPASGQFPQIAYWTNTANSVIIALLALNSSGQVLLQAPSGTTVFTSTMAIAPNTEYRIELVLDVGTTTSNGILGFGMTTKLGALTSTNSSSNAYFYSTTANLGTTGVGRLSVGKLSATWPATQRFELRVSTDLTFTSDPATWLGPKSSDFLGSLDLTGSGALSFGAVARVSGSLALSGSGALTFPTRTPAVPGSLTLSGSGALTFPTTTPRVTGSLALTGSGVLQLLGSTGAAFGLLNLTGTGTLVFFPNKVTTKGTLALTGSGALTFVGKPSLGGLLVLAGSGVLVMTPNGITAHLKAWNGTSWQPVVVRAWDGTQWKLATGRAWTGTAWV
jgi:hypothetical protein